MMIDEIRVLRREVNEKLTDEEIGDRLFLLGCFKDELNEMEVEAMDESQLKAHKWLSGLIDSIIEQQR